MDKLHIDLKEKEKIYFASDFHLGAPDNMSSRERELQIICWLKSIKKDAAAILLVGDIFDFWFEYPQVIPKGFIRFQSQLVELREDGVPIYFFHGNHDMWMFDYFPSEFDIPVYSDNLVLTTQAHQLFVGHGDGLGPGDRMYKILKRVFRSKIGQWGFKWLHPNIGMGIANYWSSKSRISSTKKDEGFSGDEEWLFQYAKQVEKTDHHDYYIFGHRHLPLEMALSDSSKYINLGEWVNAKTYGEYSLNEGMKLKKWEQ
jgi:UDP-2,3-diacylglucosamine hydrolase